MLHVTFSICFSTDKAIVLKHHPDKRKAAGEQISEGDNDYFTCITKGTWYRAAFVWTTITHVPTVIVDARQRSKPCLTL